LNTGYQLLRGLMITLELAAIVLAVGTVAGIFGGVLFVWGGRPVRALMSGFIFIVRGIPLLCQVFIVFFVLPLIGLRFSPFVSAALALSIFAFATITEIVRGGIQTIPHGQFEGAISLGFRYWQAMRTIILPQAFRILLPPLINQFVFLIKATSLISLLGVAELMYTGREVIERTLLGFEVMMMIWFIYTAVCYPLTLLGRRMEALAQKGVRPTE
jgi:polar amino acid transport system permease protein